MKFDRILPMTRGLSKLAVARTLGKRFPYSITFILTHRCNFQCAYCDIPAAAGDEMSEAEFKSAIDTFADAGMSRASFSGGEVLIREDATRIIAHAKSRGLFTSLNTNGWLVERHLDALAGNLDMMVLSLDGQAAIHDEVRRKAGSQSRVLQAVELAHERGIAVATITVLSKPNLHVIEPVLSLAERHGFWAYFQPAYTDCFDHHRGLDPALTGEMLASIAQRLSDAKKAGRPVAASSGFLERLARGPAFGDCASCAAGRYFASVMPDGTVVPCHLVSKEAVYPNGRHVGFVRAFEQMPHPTSGPGCAISPYQESDLIFRLDLRAITSALERVVKPVSSGAAHGA